VNSEIGELLALIPALGDGSSEAAIKIANLLAENSLWKRLPTSVFGGMIWERLIPCCRNYLKQATNSLSSGTITMIAMQHSFSQDQTATTAVIFLLDEEGAVIEPSVRLYTSIRLFFATFGVSTQPGIPGVTIQTSDWSREELEEVIPVLLMALAS